MDTLKKKKDMPYVVFLLHQTYFAFSAENVKSIVELPAVVKVPSLPSHFRGVINLRGQVIPLMDLRSRLGFQSLKQESAELCAELEQREKDHIGWLDELRKSVEERREFKLATDPHKCAFGKWYDKYKSNNPDIQILLKRFDEPHRAIHGIAEKVKEHERLGEYDTCLQIIQATQNKELAEMIKLFAALGDYLHNDLREIAVILERSNGKQYAVAMDQVSSVENLVEESFEELSDLVFADGEKEHAIRAIGKRERDEVRIQILDPDHLVGSSAATAIDTSLRA